MKSILFAAVFIVSGSVQAHQWIVQNAARTQTRIPGIQFKEEISFERERSYWVVEADSKYSRDEIKKLLGASQVDPDFEIGLLNHEIAERPEEAVTAWHVGKLSYDKLPAESDGRGVIVAVLDTGTDVKHDALAKRIWINEKEIPANGIDDDGNGFIDDVNGFNFGEQISDVTDTQGHGTHCAGIIAAEKQKDGNAQGVAPGVKVMPLLIISTKANPKAFLSDAAKAVKYAVDNGAKVLSNSWRVYKSWGAYDPSEKNTVLLKEAIAYAGSKGAIFVVAAGNETKNLDEADKKDPIYPSGYTGLANMIVVAASDSSDRLSGFSNYGKTTVHVAAPGSDILSTLPKNKWSKMSGTSMATPLVSGALARAISKGLTWEQAIEYLIKSSDAKKEFETKVIANGRINLVEYLK